MRESGNPANVYLCQWDVIKERMVWGVMEREKALTAGLIDPNNFSIASNVDDEARLHATSKVKHVHAAKGKKQVSSHQNKEARVLTSSKCGVERVGDKRRGECEDREEAFSERASNGQTPHGFIFSCRKRAKAGGVSLSLRDEDKAKAVPQPRQTQ